MGGPAHVGCELNPLPASPYMYTHFPLSSSSATLHTQGLGDADLTFQPSLNPRSLRLAAEREARELFQEPAGSARPFSAGAPWEALSQHARSGLRAAAVAAFHLTSA